MSILQRFLTWLGATVIQRLEDDLTLAYADTEDAWDHYYKLREQVADLQREIEEVTDRHVEFVPKLRVEEVELIRQHNRKQFYRLVEE